MTAIVGLDLSLSATGLAWRGYNGEVQVTTVRTSRQEHPAGWGPALRYRRIVVEVLRHVRHDTLVVKEQRLENLDTPSNSMLDLAGLHAVVEYALAAAFVPFVDVNLQVLKAYAVKGHASKDEMVAAARDQLCGRPVVWRPSPTAEPLYSQLPHVFNDNEADALWLLAMACQKYGRPLHRPPVHRAARIDKIQWPHWRWPIDVEATT